MKKFDANHLREHFANRFPPTAAELAIRYDHLTDAEFEAELVRPRRSDERPPPALYSECEKRFGIDASVYLEGHRAAIKAALLADIPPWKWWHIFPAFLFNAYCRFLGLVPLPFILAGLGAKTG